MTFEPNQTVYLPNGREAVYVMQNGDQHLVRVMLEVEEYETGPHVYPDEKITVVQKVYAAAPVEVFDPLIVERREKLNELAREITAMRAQLADAAKNKIAIEKAATKYPCIQQALDFIEGRITHVVAWSGYGGARVQTINEAFEDVEAWGGRRNFEGMKLLNLFGTDKHGRSVAWGLNQYRDGSGSSHTQIWPASSEEEARAKVRDLVEAAFAAWRTGEEKWWVGHIGIAETLKINPWITPPDDWLAHQKRIEGEQRAAKIAKLREEIAKLEDAA